MKWLQPLYVIVLIAGVVGAIIVGLRVVPSAHTPAQTVSYAELISIVLTSLTAVLAMFALVVGVLAIWGYQSIKAGARTVIDGHTAALLAEMNARIANHLANVDRQLSDDALSQRIDARVEAIASALAYRDASPQTSDTIESAQLAEKYPDTRAEGGPDDHTPSGSERPDTSPPTETSS